MRSSRTSARARSLGFPAGGSSSHGFSLVELVIVIGIIAITMGIAVYLLTRSRETMSVERATVVLKTRIEKAQTLAAVAGSRLGTTRLTADASCIAGPTPHLWVQITPAGQVVLPAVVTYDSATDIMTVQCEIFDLTQETNGLGAIVSPTATTLFGFTTDGRIVVPGVAEQSVFISVRPTNGAGRHFGFRVLPSGVFCQASDPARQACDEDVGA